MSYVSPQGEQSTSTEIAALTALVQLANTPSGFFIQKTGAGVFVNGRAHKAVTVVANSAVPTFNTDTCDALSITGLSAGINSMSTNMSGSPQNFDTLVVRIKDNGQAQTINWGGNFEAKGVALPTTTSAGKVLTVGFIYDSVTAKWGCVASAQEQ